MNLSSDYEELFKTFAKHKVKYLVIGAYAVIYYTEPQHTKDIDIWIKPDKENAEKVFAALAEFGAPLINVAEDLFTQKNMMYQIGVAPVRIDILMGVEGLDFDICYRKREKVEYGNLMVDFVDISSLIKAKTISKRDKDKTDIPKLRKVKNKQKNGGKEL